MTRTDQLKADVQDVSGSVLGELPAEERIQVFAKEAAEGNEERIELLADTAPTKRYRATDLDYLDGVKRLSTLSLKARYELQKRYQAIIEHESTRDKYMALMLLNEALSRLSERNFEIGEFGSFMPPEGHDMGYADDEKLAPDIAYLATKYRDLWEAVPADTLADKTGRESELFSNLAAIGLMAYRDDLSGGAFDDIDTGRIASEVYLTEIHLLATVRDFHTRFHGWRLFAEETLDISLDEFLSISEVEEREAMEMAHGIAEIDEELGANTLSMMQDYLDAYPSILEERCDGEVDVDLDADARELANKIADAADLP